LAAILKGRFLNFAGKIDIFLKNHENMPCTLAAILKTVKN
jgi:hypothetical protein